MVDEPLGQQWSDLLAAVKAEAAGSAQKIHDLGVLIGEQLDNLEAGGDAGAAATRAKVAKVINKT